MGLRTYGATGRVLAGGVMAVFGLVLLIGAYTYRLDHAEAASNRLTGPLVESLSLIFMALAGVFVAAGLFVAARALRQTIKARQAGIGSGFGGEDP